MRTSVGIHGIGVHLPDEVRANDWWSGDLVARWRKQRAIMHEVDPSAFRTEGARRVAQAIAEVRDDPFQGCKERRVLPAGALPSAMELEAARRAIENAGIDPQDIGIVLCDSTVPDYLLTSNACLLHHNLGLRPRCITVATSLVCNSFLLQLAIAESMIAGGQGPFALLVQSAGFSRIVPYEQPHSAWFGDGCTAVIVGPVADGRGIVASSHGTNGAYHKMIVAGVPGRRWYDDGPVHLYAEAPLVARQGFLEIADLALEGCGAVLESAGSRAAAIRFYASHQGTPWLRRVTQDYLGLSHATSMETYAWAGNLAGANIPLALHLGVKEGALEAGDEVLLFAGGAGITYSTTLLRWGR